MGMLITILADSVAVQYSLNISVSGYANYGRFICFKVFVMVCSRALEGCLKISEGLVCVDRV